MTPIEHLALSIVDAACTNRLRNQWFVSSDGVVQVYVRFGLVYVPVRGEYLLALTVANISCAVQRVGLGSTLLQLLIDSRVSDIVIIESILNDGWLERLLSCGWQATSHHVQLCPSVYKYTNRESL